MAVSLKFTFQYGEIKRLSGVTGTGGLVKFTFQYGEIKSGRHTGQYSRVNNLHSSMERLKVMYGNFITGRYLNLHSSMERLKDEAELDRLQRALNLHSSMERLKALLDRRYDCEYTIYIPVWRD